MLRILALALIAFGLTLDLDAAPVRAAPNDAALAGKVSSAADGAMEGVVVSAQRQGSTVIVSVVSDHDGHYSFPAARLAPGHYFVSIRAEGYELDGAGVTDIAAGKTGDVWTASMFTDRVVRLTPETGEFVQYPLPEQATNIRRVFIDDHGPRPVFWAGSNHDAGILKVEPLDQ